MFALVFLQASIVSLLAGAGAWLLLHAAARAWPGLEARRTPWLLAVAAIAGTLALGLLPSAARPSMVPAIELPGVRAAANPGPGHGPAGVLATDQGAAGNDAGFDDGDAALIAPSPALLWLGYSWLALYTAGLAATAAKWLRAKRHLDALLAASTRLDRSALAAHAGFESLHRDLPEVREIDAPIAPMLAGLARPVLLLPRHLRDFDPAQQRLVIEHELTHLARRDPLWMHASFLLQAIQWFNPIVARLGKRLAWAQELGCDRNVLQGLPPAQRRHYAAALVTQMRAQSLPDHGTALAFGSRTVDAVAARIRMIRDGVPAMPRTVNSALSYAVLPAVLAASVLLQPALAWRLDDAVPAAQPAPAAAAQPASLPHWQAPMESMRVSAFFGILHAPTGRLHRGMDFAVPTGTRIVAPAEGVVIASTNHYAGEDKWGELIVIEHANGLRSLYAHMDKRMVRLGERVAAGQQIGTSGASGKATGPHLHMEVSLDGDNIDPQAVLGKLEGNATRTALRRLKASRAS
ncbi:M23/M56 family metallopeptidase [Pseudoduganella sp. R-31]|uniref:M23/M56 family metallopeptidase n=1 Tax=unclassified Pseudoduganella TaxID=2637179 RepID=UPI003CF0E421